MSQLAIDGSEQVPPLVFGDGLCGCGCGASLVGRSARAKYVDRNHAQAAYRQRVKREMERVGLPALPSLRAAGVSRPTIDHNGDAENVQKRAVRRKPSGAQVSYFKAIDVLSRELDIDPAEIRCALRLALPATQRARLEQSNVIPMRASNEKTRDERKAA